jgi:hypothetical protein
LDERARAVTYRGSATSTAWSAMTHWTASSIETLLVIATEREMLFETVTVFQKLAGIERSILAFQ